MDSSTDRWWESTLLNKFWMASRQNRDSHWRIKLPSKGVRYTDALPRCRASRPRGALRSRVLERNLCRDRASLLNGGPWAVQSLARPFARGEPSISLEEKCFQSCSERCGPEGHLLWPPHYWRRPPCP